MKIVIALGGNAILRKGENFKDLGRHVKEVCKKIKKISRGNKIIITSGNGSEIGYLLLQNDNLYRKRILIVYNCLLFAFVLDNN